MQKLVLTEDNAIFHRIKIEKKKSDKGTDEAAATLATDGVKCASINTRSNVISICTVPVKIKRSSGNKIIRTDALSDSCSQGNLILDQLRDHLCIPGRGTSVTIEMTNGDFKSTSKAIDGLQVSVITDDKICGYHCQQLSREKNFQLIMMTSLNQDI